MIAASLFDADANVSLYSDDTSFLGDFEFESIPRVGESVLIWVQGSTRTYEVLSVCHLGDSTDKKRAGFDYAGANALQLVVRETGKRLPLASLGAS